LAERRLDEAVLGRTLAETERLNREREVAARTARAAVRRAHGGRRPAVLRRMLATALLIGLVGALALALQRLAP
jgi:hypothetical protein